jgi:hypothetical protein
MLDRTQMCYVIWTGRNSVVCHLAAPFSVGYCLHRQVLVTVISVSVKVYED